MGGHARRENGARKSRVSQPTRNRRSCNCACLGKGASRIPSALSGASAVVALHNCVTDQVLAWHVSCSGAGRMMSWLRAPICWLPGAERPRDRKPGDQRTTGPEDHRNREPRDQRTRRPEDHGTRGPETTGPQTTGPRTRRGPRAWPNFPKPNLGRTFQKETPDPV